jgi:hypothetical protein
MADLDLGVTIRWDTNGSSLPEAATRCLQATLFFAYGIHYFSIFRLRSRIWGQMK